MRLVIKSRMRGGRPLYIAGKAGAQAVLLKTALKE
jgi:hypothetical protein